MRLHLRPAAVAEVEEARSWYESRRPGLGEAFVRELERTFRTILAHPRRFRRVARSARVALLRRFPYAVAYCIGTGFVSVLAVYHGRRDPRRLLGN